MTLNRTEIDYSKYKQADHHELTALDNTPEDMVLNEQDLIALSSEQLSKVYDIYRSQKLDANGAQTKPIDETKFKQEVIKKATSPQELVRSSAKNSQFLMFGESHSSPSTRAYMASLIPTLKEEGFQYFAIEVDSNRQEDIDYYLETCDASRLADLTWIDKEYLTILDACSESGLKVICIDNHLGNEDRGKVDQKMYDKLQSEVLTANPIAKVAIYIGKHHIEESKSLSFVKDGIITDDGRETGRLGFLLERLAPGKSQSISLIDRNDTSMHGEIETTLLAAKEDSFALNVDLPFFFSIQSGPAMFKTTLGCDYDSLIVF